MVLSAATAWGLKRSSGRLHRVQETPPGSATVTDDVIMLVQTGHLFLGVYNEVSSMLQEESPSFVQSNPTQSMEANS